MPNAAVRRGCQRLASGAICAIPFDWSATLALDEGGAIVGGEWTGDPPDGPDTLSFIAGGPSLTDAGTLEVNEGIRWDVVDALARASVEEQSANPTVDLRQFGGSVSP